MSTPYYQDGHVTLYHGDCLDALRHLPDASIDAVVTDPPYGLSNTDPGHVADTITRWVNGERDYLPSTGGGFMGKAWDSFVPPVAVWDECMRVLKPGGHVLAFAGSRTFDLMTLSIRLAGFDIRDSIAWLYGSGFPKSLDVSKAIASGTGRPEDIRRMAMGDDYTSSGRGRVNYDNGGGSKMNGAVGALDLPDSARDWQGWGTALKPAFEPVVVARKPLAGNTASNVLAHGTGALNIDACRIHTPGSESKAYTVKRMKPGATLERTGGNWRPEDGTDLPWETGREYQGKTADGRWPANVVLDESQAEVLDQQSGVSSSRIGKPRGADAGDGWGMTATGAEYGDSGGASRFFPTFRYEPKAPTSERPRVNGTAHPTVKPLDFMRWLVRLVTPPGGTVLEPFAGSGTTVEACLIEGFRCVAIEREADYLPLIESRIHRQRNPIEAIRLAGDDLGLFDSEAWQQ